METEDQATTGRGLPPHSATAPEGVPASPVCGTAGRRFCAGRVVAGGLAVVACLVALVLFLYMPPPDGRPQPKPPEAGLQLPPLFVGWGQPDLAIALSGQQHGYHQPCGCSRPQYGGLARRYNFLTYLKERKSWPLVAVDLGDIPELPKRFGEQTMLKYIYSLKSLKEIGYTAVGFGLHEMSMPLLEAMNGYALNNPSPRVLMTNLLTSEKPNDPFHETVKPWAVGGDGKTPKVGVLALMAPSVERQVKDPDVRLYRDTGKVLEKALGELRTRNVELVVVLYQGTVAEARLCAQYCAGRHKADKSFPAVNVILRLDDDTPSGMAEKVGDSLIVGIGHKGKYIGIIGAFRTGKAAEPWQLKYQLVQLGPEYETPEGKEHENPVMRLMEEYAQDVKDGKYLAKVRQVPHEVQLNFKDAEYVGSKECKSCHPAAYKVWENSKHAHAYETLEKATRPKNRQYDPECLVCHVVGLGQKTGFTDAVKTPFLKNVGCESCHGPGSEHMANPKNPKIHAAINPYKAPPNEKEEQRIRRLNRLDMACQSCHDSDNDVHWQLEPKWAKIIHMLPRNAAPKQNGK